MNTPAHQDDTRVEPVPKRLKANMPTAQEPRAHSKNSVRLVPWRQPSWPVFLPLVFAANVGVATLAWFVVGLFMR